MQRGLKPKKVVCLLFVPGWVRAMSPSPAVLHVLGCFMHVCVTLGLGWPEEMAALAFQSSFEVSRPRSC